MQSNDNNTDCETDGSCESDESDSSQDGVTVPEDFQKQVHQVMSKASSKHHIAHIRSAMNDKEDEMRKAEMASQSKGSKGKVKNFSMDDAPSGLNY